MHGIQSMIAILQGKRRNIPGDIIAQTPEPILYDDIHRLQIP